MSSDNPFAPPGAPLQDPPASIDLASRVSRFLAAIIDAVIILTLFGPLFFAFGVFDGWPNIQPLSLPKQLGLAAAGFALFLALHGYLLATRGQTIGKWFVGVQIVRVDGTHVDFGRLLGLRYFPFGLLSMIPGLGPLASLADDLFIFSESRRCLHDRLADTIVIRARS